MGRIPIEELLAVDHRNPDDATPISPLHLPKTARVMPAGFGRKPGDPLVFQEEIEVSFRLVEREWRYKDSGDASVKRERTWRIEFAVEKGGPIQRGHFLIVAQEPYGNRWVQTVPFHQYSKKQESERALPAVPAGDLGPALDTAAWLDRHVTHDPWESDTRLVAGISHPHGFACDDPRNSAEDLILGACPDVEAITREIMESPEIGRLLHETQHGRIVYWYQRDLGYEPPPLHQEVKDDAISLMGISARQALAGPRRACDEWVGVPVWKWVDLVYRDHLNECNKRTYQGLAARELHESEGLRSEKQRIRRIARCT